MLTILFAQPHCSASITLISHQYHRTFSNYPAKNRMYNAMVHLLRAANQEPSVFVFLHSSSQSTFQIMLFMRSLICSLFLSLPSLSLFLFHSFSLFLIANYQHYFRTLPHITERCKLSPNGKTVALLAKSKEIVCLFPFFL